MFIEGCSYNVVIVIFVLLRNREQKKICNKTTRKTWDEPWTLAKLVRKFETEVVSTMKRGKATNNSVKDDEYNTFPSYHCYSFNWPSCNLYIKKV